MGREMTFPGAQKTRFELKNWIIEEIVIFLQTKNS